RLWLGEIRDLAGQLAACARSLEARGETANLALLECEEGRAWEEAGELARAEDCWRRAEELAKPLSPGPIRADVLLQLGRLEHLRGRLPAALRRYEDALVQDSCGPQQLELNLRRLLVHLEMGPEGQALREAGSLFHGLALDEIAEEIQPLARAVSALVGGTL